MRTPVDWAALVTVMVLIVAGLAACSGTPPSRFYLLDRDSTGAAPSTGPVVFVDQVTVVTYADRSQFVTRSEDGRARFEEFDVWAEPISEQITRYLVDALGSRFGYDRVQKTPSRRAFDPDWRVAVDVLRLDTNQAGTVTLDARWTLFAGGNEEFAATGRERIVEPSDPVNVPTRLPALQRALDALADRIVNDMSARRRR